MDFNVEAVNWDSVKRVKRARIIADEISRSIGIKEHCSALEFGCGTGLISFNLADKFEHITLVDTSRGMIEKLNQKIQDLKVTNMTAFETDINSDSCIKDSFDVIYTSMALHHIIDTGATLKSLFDMLNSGGYLCIVDLDEEDGSFHKSEKDFNGHNGFNQGTLKEMLEGIGFKSVVSNTFYNDCKIVDDLRIEYSLFLLVGKK